MTKKKWTVMVYMAGDNNLSLEMSYSLQKLHEVSKNRNENINLFVYYDGCLTNAPTGTFQALQKT